jgi:Na+/H+-dicarboxylate symporter
MGRLHDLHPLSTLFKSLIRANVPSLQILFVVWLTPLGVSSLVAGSILRACDLVLLLKSLALYVFTILAGFGVHCFVVLPSLLYMYTRKDPFKAVR